MNTDSALGIVPGGRGNDFARVLGIPKEPAQAARLLVDGEVRLVDVGNVDGKPFVGIASVGFDSVANRMANEARFVKGGLVYLYAGIRTLVEWKHTRFEATVDGVTHTITGYGVAVANSKAYGGGMYLVPHAELDDGRLDVLMSGADSKLHHLTLIPKIFKGAHVDDPYIQWFAGATVELSSERPFTVYADGDPIGQLPVTIGVSKQSLKVIVPR
jgi:YegS/Rv2252/BmrU family lipid kinase